MQPNNKPRHRQSLIPPNPLEKDRLEPELDYFLVRLHIDSHLD